MSLPVAYCRQGLPVLRTVLGEGREAAESSVLSGFRALTMNWPARRLSCGHRNKDRPHASGQSASLALAPRFARINRLNFGRVRVFETLLAFGIVERLAQRGDSQKANETTP